ncbi:hypothetical protein SmJEL517_g02400 [Synchytrium microbalum]|uniref:Uncharacterized protein n=1 Tax=Synchytrium microbalum TaxID=1806994 RepID=A0A507CBW6_9FUNG|nr:uncharacterized protein SmJEL517_g02400 [Synchytrium microbalum]TPX35055.1 hypothetical protein SmJEL517_g02400 [Synchytrium microbalum]
MDIDDYEEELMPGVYLTRHRRSNTANQRTRNPMKGIEDSYELLEIESLRLKNSVKLLLQSNQQMREFPEDPDLKIAIAENVIIINRQFEAIRTIEARMKDLAGTGRCGSELNASAAASLPSSSIATAPSAVVHTQASSSTSRPLNQPSQSSESASDDDGGLYL